MPIRRKIISLLGLIGLIYLGSYVALVTTGKFVRYDVPMFTNYPISIR